MSAPAPQTVPAVLVAEATGKSSVIWVTPGGADRAHLVWHVWHDDAAFVLTGAGEQADPGLVDGVTATVSVRSKDTGGLAVSWPAAVSRVPARSGLWDAVVPLLIGARLNLADGEAAADRWADDGAALWRLQPAGAPSQTAEHPVADAGRADVGPTANGTPVPKPFSIRLWPRRGR